MLMDLLTALAVVGLAIALAVTGLVVVRRRVPRDVLLPDHEIASPQFQVLGVMASVLFAFVTVIAWQDYQAAQQAVELEAAQLADLYRDAGEYPEGDRRRLRHQLRAYAESVVTEEWPSMARGDASPRARAEFDRLWAVYHTLRVGDLTGLATQIETFRRMNELGDNRRLRLRRSRPHLPGVLWTALVLCGVATIGFGYFFGGARLPAQMLMTAILAGTTALLLVVILVLERPFAGAARIPPVPFVELFERWRALGD